MQSYPGVRKSVAFFFFFRKCPEYLKSRDGGGDALNEDGETGYKGPLETV